MRKLVFVFQEPGMIEAIATDPSKETDMARSTGYADSVVPDLSVDRDTETLQPYAWMCYNFERTYPLIIWGLKLFMADELFDVPQAGLTNMPLHAVFSWAYYHFVLKDGTRLPRDARLPVNSPRDLTRLVLGYSASAA